ncbi:hypothetical protein FVA74_09170 [Salinibacterium sp. dk2585]|uniref:FHA domain-containing protein n=1 Tax=unclassified Salinibacterium TaxID=2632331 RepID=UPI0011C24FA6|nr:MULTISPECIES: FHA domain-containing protein [unclassified Salinibacterium]QEE61725.1 hypothetical protein FVA74_09170 [Salinibacterium sp. dk2585]TXK54720.1 hypothetical protein FVP63_06790 [Salinibacterium sp. dk5596]
MTCNHCGTALPRGAIFCGECGRRVSAPADTITPPPVAERSAQAPAVQSVTPTGEDGLVPPPPTPQRDAASESQGWSLTAEADAAVDAASAAADAATQAAPDEVTGDARPEPKAPASTPVVRNPLTCQQCGSQMGPGDIFCGECGSVSKSVTAAFTGVIDTRRAEQAPAAPSAPPSTSPQLVAPGAAAAAIPLPTMPVFVQSPPGAPPKQVEDAVPSPPVEESSAPASAADAERSSARPPEDASPVAPTVPSPGEEPAPIVSSPPVAPPQVSPVASRRPAVPSDTDDEDVEATRIVHRRGGERFVLQFSTGESVTVYGTGLVGRNPRPEPGEFFDQLVRVLDTGRSVSKTHLEFGQEAGVFWIKDRFSGNGTVLKEPDADPRRCEADKRYRVVRGSRVEIGEQFFVVS